MHKFTIFTVFVAIIVLSVVGELATQDKNSDDLGADVLRVQENYGEEQFKLEEVADEVPTPPVSVPVPPPVTVVEESEPEEPEEDAEPEPILIETIKKQAEEAESFLAATLPEVNSNFSFTKEAFTGKIFQLIDIQDLLLEVGFQGSIQNGPVVEAIGYEMHALDEVMAAEVYQLIKKKTALYPDITTNETNKYGDGSFYVNHVRKPNEAFLVVRIRKNVYAFAYTKTFHDQIEKILTLLQIG